ncbi:glycoside hydrolase family 17 protein, partial [Dissophora ornata]
NPNLYKSFYGIDYNPAKSLMPWCGATLQNVVDDVILMSQLTNRIRLYGMDCDQAALTFQAIQALNLNSTMKVVLTVWVDKDPTTYQRQYDTLFKVLDTYGTDMVQGISVGNEVLFRQEMNLTSLASLMATIRTNFQARYGKAIPVFTSDIGNNLNSTLASVSDQLEGNLHPYFAGTQVSDAAAWTLGQYNDTILANPTKAGIKGAISEVGWPSAPATSVYAPSAVPGLANMQTLIDTFICQANAAGVPYYWFEFKDEPWKIDPLVPVEPYWGIFDKDGNLKIKVPNCPVP